MSYAKPKGVALVSTGVKLPPDLRKWLEDTAERDSRTLSHQITHILRQHQLRELGHAPAPQEAAAT